MKKTLLFTISFFSALTFGFAQTSISYDAAGATSQTFTVGNQATDNLQAGIANLTSATGTVTDSGGFIGFNAASITDNTTTGTFTFTISTNSATSINSDLSFEIQKRKGISTAGTISVTGYPDVAFNFASEGSTTGTEGKLIEFGEISLITGTDLTVTVTLTSMTHVESTQTGIFRLENVLVNTTAPLSIDDVAQTTVNFTAEEGFSDGALYNQSGWDSSFTGTTWMVDTSIGAITLSNDLQRAAWDYSFAISRNREILTFRVDLKFIGTFGTNNNPLLKVGFSSSSDVANSTPPANVVFLRTASSNTQLQLSNNDNSGPLSPNASLLIADCQATGESDDLAVLVTLTLGADAASSTISSKLMNLTDGTETVIGSYTGINANIFTAATTTNIYGFLHAQTLTTTGNNAITQVQVSSVTMTHGDYLYSVVNKYGGSTSSSTNRINNYGKIGSGNLFVNKNGKIISY